MNIIKFINRNDFSTTQQRAKDHFVWGFNYVTYGVVSDIVVIGIESIVKVEIKGIFTGFYIMGKLAIAENRRVYFIETYKRSFLPRGTKLCLIFLQMSID